MTRYIVITKPYAFDGESDIITMMFQAGLQRLHLRKPECLADDYKRVLDGIPKCYHNRIVTHDHFELVEEYGLAGVHLNSRNRTAPACLCSVSTSCHSIDELIEKKRDGYVRDDGSHGQYDYLTLSPIFDSISKQGYTSAFAEDTLMELYRQGVIDDRVWALGGITYEKIATVTEKYGFKGGLILGDAWRFDEKLPVVLTIAGSDTSAGAGIQQDLKTITNCKCYGATAITALTSQNTLGVQDVMPVPAEVVEKQMRSVFDDLSVKAVKIGMIPDINVAKVIVKVLLEERRCRLLPVVCDPVMISTSGRRLMSEECQEYVVRHLFPLCTLITPNIPEWESGLCHTDDCDTAFLVKGGHAAGNGMTDTLYIYKEGCEHRFTTDRIETGNLHGTGCTLSSAIACELAKGHSLVPAVKQAKEYITHAIEGGKNLHIGHGNGPLWYEM